MDLNLYASYGPIFSHEPEVYASEGGSKKQRRCRFCSLQKKTKHTIYSCDKCMIPLCITPCFKDYHTVENLPDQEISEHTSADE